MTPAAFALPSTPPMAQPQPVRSAAGMLLRSNRTVPPGPGVTSGLNTWPVVSEAPVISHNW